MLKMRFEWAILVVVAALLGSAWIVYSREPVAETAVSTRPTVAAPIVGYQAPQFTLQTPAGDGYALADYVVQAGGQPVVLNFWATWCAPCRIEMPHFQRAHEKYDGQIAFLGVNQQETPEQIEAFGAEFDITYPLLVDQDRTVNNLYGIVNLPTTVFIDDTGTVREIIVGTINQAVLEDRIERLLEE